MVYNVSFEYSDNKQFKEVYKKLAKEKGFSMSVISEKLGYSTPQQLTNLFNKKNITLKELKDLLNAIDCNFEICVKQKV